MQANVEEKRCTVINLDRITENRGYPKSNVDEVLSGSTEHRLRIKYQAHLRCGLLFSPIQTDP